MDKNTSLGDSSETHLQGFLEKSCEIQYPSQASVTHGYQLDNVPLYGLSLPVSLPMSLTPARWDHIPK